MDDILKDPHEIPLDILFPSLPPENREVMRDFLDSYAEIAYQVYERLEKENKVDGVFASKQKRKLADITKRKDPKNPIKVDDFTVRFPLGLL